MAKRRPSGDGMVRQRPNGLWEGRIVAGHKADGRPIFRSVFSRTQKELMAKLDALKETYCGISLTEDSILTLGEWLEKWFEGKRRSLRPSTVQYYESMIRTYIIPRLGSRRLTQLTATEVGLFCSELKERGREKEHPKNGLALSSSTVRSVHGVLRQALADAQKQGLIPDNPAEHTVLPRKERKEIRVLLRPQIDALLDSVREDGFWYDFFYTEIATGLRLGEICALRWEDLDAGAGRLHVQRSLHREAGEDKTGDTKTREGNRVLVLPESLKTILLRRREGTDSPWIFPHPDDPARPVSPSTAYGKLQRSLKKAGLPALRFHDLRHTFATVAESGGVDPKTLASLLGHTDAAFTLDTYTHITSDMQRQAARVTGDFLTDTLGGGLKPWENKKAP